MFKQRLVKPLSESEISEQGVGKVRALFPIFLPLIFNLIKFCVRKHLKRMFSLPGVPSPAVLGGTPGVVCGSELEGKATDEAPELGSVGHPKQCFCSEHRVS